MTSSDDWDEKPGLPQLLLLGNGPSCNKTCLRGFANNKGADQPVHPCSLISAFVIRLLESIISRLATGEVSIFQLVSVGEQNKLNLHLLETPKTGFVATRPKCAKNQNPMNWLTIFLPVTTYVLCSSCLLMFLLSCQPRVTLMSCFVYKVIRDLESIDLLQIGLIHK